jgi:hypothetical protein
MWKRSSSREKRRRRGCVTIEGGLEADVGALPLAARLMSASRQPRRLLESGVDLGDQPVGQLPDVFFECEGRLWRSG